MYRTCIYCSAGLGANEVIEAFPVGRSVAFDAAKGRLWAVCPKCARWNLAPIEERWEAVEEAERIFRDTRLRVQHENVGLAKLRDGTCLIRIGDALTGELAAWRYGREMTRRYARLRPLRRAAGIADSALNGGYLVWYALFGSVVPLVAVATGVAQQLWAYRQGRVVVHALPSGEGRRMAQIRRADLAGARLSAPDDGRGLRLLLPYSGEGPRGDWGRWSLVLRGTDARTALARTLLHLNRAGADAGTVDQGIRMISYAGSADEFVRGIAREPLNLVLQRGVQVGSATAWGLDDGPPGGRPITPATALALEMALHAETERRALEGELAELREMWRQAEEIADIADRLPDVPAPDAPRL